VGNAAAHHGGVEGAVIDDDAGAFRGRRVLGIRAGLDVVAAHDQLVASVFAFLTEVAPIDGQGGFAGGQGGVRVIGDLAAAHHELGGRAAFDDSADVGVHDAFDAGIVTGHIAAADDLLDGPALDGEGDVTRSARFRSADIPLVKGAAHKMVGILS